MIKTFHPKIEVMLIKNVTNPRGVSERYSGTNNLVNLAPFLGESGSVVTHKSIDYVAGSFTITLTKKLFKDIKDSLYGLISPMDGIEIRMTGEPHKYSGQLPIIMRGFVSTVRRSDIMGPDGKPVRAVVITGFDYGKLFINYQIFHLIGHVEGRNLVTAYKFMELTGLESTVLPVEDFIGVALDLFINPYLKRIFDQKNRDESESAIRVGYTSGGVPGSVYAQGVNPEDASIWNLMARYADLPWNELFIESTETSVAINDRSRPDNAALTFRQKPYKDWQTGNYIFKGASADEFTIDDVDVVSINASRSDDNVMNTFWVYVPSLIGMNSTSFRAAALGARDNSVIVENHPNNSPDLYYYRKYEAVTRLSNWTHFTTNLPEKEFIEANATLEDWARQRRLELIELNKDNAMFESGDMIIRGNERARVGTYIKIRQGQIEPEHYIKTVSHKFLPFRSYTTTMEFIRGTGYRERLRLAASPHFNEQGRGV